MGLGRLLLTTLAAFVAGAVVSVITGFALFSTGFFDQSELYVPIVMFAFFGPAVIVAIFVGDRLSPAKAVTPLERPPIAGEPEAVDALRVELSRERVDERSGLIAALLLVLYVYQGLREGSVPSLAILVGVLLVHEGGHALGMLAFGYRDVRVFFLPFFGAAVTGRKEDAPAWQRAVVLLLGPVPGLLLGVALLLATRGDGLAGEIGRMAVYINVFNLLPFEPLDGGRLLGVTLFSRSRWLEAAFGALGAFAILAMGLKLGTWPLAVVAGLALLALPRRLRVAAAARRIVERDLPMGPRVETLPAETLAALDAEACVVTPPIAQLLPERAAVVRELHGRIHASPPGGLATLALVGAYGGSCLISLVAVVFAVTWSPAAKARAGGQTPAEVVPTRR